MLSISFAPLFDWWLIAALAGVGALMLLAGALRGARGLGWRTLAVGVLALALANPVLVEEERVPIPDVAAILVDESPSQRIGDRPQRTAEAVAALRRALESDDLEVRVIRAGAAASEDRLRDGTRLFEALSRALASVPRSRMAGVLAITDGQVHDVPERGEALPFGGPLHVLLTGARDERDRRIVVENAPSFGFVGREIEIEIRVEDSHADGRRADVRVTVGNAAPRTISVPVGPSHTVSVPLEHAGSNIVQLEVDAVENELTEINNRAVVEINGVRERLRVLLVSGEPHPGERVWRNFLKADPSVDLVHFTILRPPEKQDATPVRELSLIAFPIRELFEIKLDEFDLIIFDRYRRRGVLPAMYLENVARYVERGGAVLEAAGPEFATPMSLARTPLGVVLPGEPTGQVYEQGFRPRLTDVGRRHPVTADLPQSGENGARWGRWFRQIQVASRGGAMLIDGIESHPVLLVDRVGDGRVAQILSDHIWLWARGFEDGGPHAELLRRLAHWLMKEPELEEQDLRATVQGNTLRITRRSLEPDDSPVTVTTPSGETRTVTLSEESGGRATATVPIEEIGIYRVADERHQTLAAAGDLNPREFADMRASPEPLGPIVEATGGGVFWLEDGVPETRRVRAGRQTAGRGWAGLVENRDYRVASVREAPLMPAVLVLLLGLGALMLAWRREGR